MEEQIKQLIENRDAILINFKAATCDPCEMITPTLQQVKKAIGQRVAVYTVDIDEVPHLATQYHIHSLPMLVLFFEGEKVWQSTAVLSKEAIIKKVIDYTH
ncbi:thioredoxin family protein [Flavobacterium branchiophilum]|uniref:Thioredoxin n=2 Tax=Flavobacterium branchiophilum TaxID=55197 RepID=G2Z695_FLABF|nr:thioredoxin domain-containing protein [Flavobacterium branchiophilum]PDS25381.1 thiol reductase thioredoxin [Flavobacterium branchiophilum]CCB70915.1 Thioredoxin family protein [Flavobacterium branchiophilum FL-15]